MNQLAGSRLSLAPEPDEVEVSVFGPGYGECIVIHVSHNDWLIVDSCIDPKSRRPSALSYLGRLGVDPSVSVKQVIATHWHDDHIRGLGRILNECRSAEFVCSDALRPIEFLTLVTAYGKRSMMESSGVAEFHRVLNALEERRLVPKFASANKCLWSNAYPQGGEAPTILCDVWSLSPSDAEKTLAYQQISQLIPITRETKRRLPVQSPNHVAVVLWIRIGNVFILLGSDLEERGWSVIVGSQERPHAKASLFKIPHHGSITADSPDVWSEMLVASPHAVLTPFAKGKDYLPTLADVMRISARSPNTYSTALARTKGKRKRPSIVEKQIRETVRSIRQIDSSVGYVRFRSISASSPPSWHTKLFDDALPLRKLYPD